MGQKDVKSNELLSDKEKFADVVNVVVYNGRQVVKPENLETKDTAEILTVYGMHGKGDAQHKIRDILKSCIIKGTSKAIFVLMGIENQAEIQYAMPVKNMIYDGLNYGAQVNEARKMHRTEKDKVEPAEFLSGFTKDDKLTPVITITVYWGTDVWNAPRTLHEMMSTDDAELLEFVEDYHIHLLAPNEIEDFDKFQTSIGCIFEVIKVSSDKAAMDQLLTDNEKYRTLENNVVDAINLFANTDIALNEKSGVTNMCKAWEDQKLEGKLLNVIRQVLKNVNRFSSDEIADLLDEDIHTVQRILDIHKENPAADVKGIFDIIWESEYVSKKE